MGEAGVLTVRTGLDRLPVAWQDGAAS